MKKRFREIMFYYFVFSTLAAYLITVISIAAHQNWHQYFVSPVYSYCQLLAAGGALELPMEIILSILPLLFVCISFILYCLKKEYHLMFPLPVLLGNIVVLTIMTILILLNIAEIDVSKGISGRSIVRLLSLIFDIMLLIVLCWRKNAQPKRH